MKKKFITGFILSTATAVLISIAANAEVISGNYGAALEDGTPGDNVTWTLDSETGVLAYDGSGEMYSGTEYDFGLEYNAYDYAESVKKGIVSEGITKIGNNAFRECINMTEAVIAESVTSIGMEAFSNCESLTQIKLPEGLTSIEEGAFFDCFTLSEAELPIGLAHIGECAFHGCPIGKVVIPDSVTSIDGGQGVFYSPVSTIYASAGSYGAQWAVSNGYKFVPLGKTVPLIGSVVFSVNGLETQVSAKAEGFDGDKIFIAAAYDKNGIAVQVLLSNKPNWTFNSDFHHLKIMCFESLSSMRPLCEPVSVEKA